MLFNPAESIDFNGHTGPFIQYTYARIQSVLRHGSPVDYSSLSAIGLSKIERMLQLKIYLFSNTISIAAAEFNPAHLANYLYDLAKDFSSFYQNHSILKADTAEQIDYRTGLADVVGRILKSGMQLLGIAVPERM